MYKRKLLLSIFSLKTPNYHGRNFTKALLEGLEYSILLSALDNSKKVLLFKTDNKEQKEIIFNWGKMWVLIDDIQDEMPYLASDKLLKALLLSQKVFISDNPLLMDLKKCADFVNKRVSATRHWNQYKKFSLLCFNSQKSACKSRMYKNKISQTLASAENKGGAFALSMILAANPTNLNSKIAKAIFTGGSWGQAIDDFADTNKDRKHNIYTVFSSDNKPVDTFKKLTDKYKRNIIRLTNRNDLIIPFAEDLSQLAKASHTPVLSSIFGVLNS